MSSFPLILSAVFICGISIVSAKSQNGNELIFAHVIYRHGDRNIGHLYPKDQYAQERFWPEGYKQLTAEGKRQQYKLGQYFRRRYGKLLGNKYSPNKIYIQSTDYDRTIMSALANLAGMFPPTGDQIWDKELLWQPIAVHSIPKQLEYVLNLGRKCSKLDLMLANRLKESTELQRIYAQNKDNFRYWSKKSGKHIKTLDNVKNLYKTLYIESVHKKALKPWAQKAIQPNEPMEYIATYSLKWETDTPKLARLSTGFLIKEMFERFSQKIKRTLQPDRSVWIYSAHETTIARVLNSLGLFKLHIPPYASSLHFELYKEDDKNHYIQIFYRKSGEEKLTPMNIPNCGEKCTLDRLYTLYREIIPGDFESECRV